MGRESSALRWGQGADSAARNGAWAECIGAWRAGALSGNALKQRIESSPEPARAAVAWLLECEEPARFDIAWASELCERSSDLVAASLLVSEFGADPLWAQQLGLRLAPTASCEDVQFWMALQDIKDWLVIRRRADARRAALVAHRQEAVYVARNH